MVDCFSFTLPSSGGGLAESCFPLEKWYNTHDAVKAKTLYIVLLAGVKPLMVQDMSVQSH
jgi:hypothetical protein